jgi:protein arginine kinase activator
METSLDMCLECPILQQRMTGIKIDDKKTPIENETGVCCGTCGTTLESILTGNPLGCSQCYSIFEEVLINDLLSIEAVPSRLEKRLNRTKSQPLHVGKSPSTPINIPASSRISTLNEALNEALKKENYEQAAWLRDQIKDIMEKHDGTKKSPT